jgi:hypothetical protein
VTAASGKRAAPLSGTRVARPRTNCMADHDGGILPKRICLEETMNSVMVEILFIAQLARRRCRRGAALAVQQPLPRLARTAALPGVHNCEAVCAVFVGLEKAHFAPCPSSSTVHDMVGTLTAHPTNSRPRAAIPLRNGPANWRRNRRIHR